MFQCHQLVPGQPGRFGSARYGRLHADGHQRIRHARLVSRTLYVQIHFLLAR